jgi:hypothetical protein
MVTVFFVSTVLYGSAKYYSPTIVFHVVEQTLVQKAPAGTDPVLARERLQAHLAAAPDQNAKMARLLRLSEKLEKIQSLTPAELDSLLATGLEP